MVYTITCTDFKTIKELPDFWTNEKYADLLDIMDFPDIDSLAPTEIKDMCFMALTDNEPEESAELVLTYLFKDRLNAGQIQNLSHEIQTEKLWEEYAELSFHEDLFNATQILYAAYNGKFPKPEAVRFTIQIHTKKADNLATITYNTEAALIRLVTQDMPDNTLIKRLFEVQLQGATFTDAKDIIWQLTQNTVTEGMEFTITSSTYWFLDFKHASSFEAHLETEH